MARGKKTRAPGWVPQQHGAWAMLVVPAAVGTTWLVRDHGWRWAALPVMGITLVGYFLLNAATLWLKARRRPRYLPPVRAYAVATGALGLVVLAAGPGLAGWLVAAGPLVAVALVLASQRRDRALASGLVTVAAACLATPLLWSAGLEAHPPLGALGSWAAALGEPGPTGDGARRIGFLALAELAYFGGTVVYVKTMIRERGSHGWLAASIGWHATATAALGLAAALGIPAAVTALGAWWLAVVLGLATVRAALMPSLGLLLGRSITPMQVGLVEIGFSVALLVGALLA